MTGKKALFPESSRCFERRGPKVNRSIVPILASAVLTLSACSDGVRFVNGVTDSSGMTAGVGGNSLPDQVAFGGVSNIAAVPAGTYSVRLTSGTDAQPTGAFNITADGVGVASGKIATVLTYGSLANQTAAAFSAQGSLKGSNRLELQPLNAAFQASQNNPSLTFVIRPIGGGTGTALRTPLGHATTPMEIVAGTYELLVMKDECGFNGVSCNSSPPMFDSGPNGVVLPGSAGTTAFQIVILDALQQPNGSPVSLLLLDANDGHVSLFNGGS